MLQISNSIIRYSILYPCKESPLQPFVDTLYIFMPTTICRHSTFFCATFHPVIMLGRCASSLGLADSLIQDESMSSTSSTSNPHSGRLGKPDGAWCFSNDSIPTGEAELTVKLNGRMFVSAVASQGPPASMWPASYNHLVAFSVACSLDEMTWLDLNDGNLVSDDFFF